MWDIYIVYRFDGLMCMWFWLGFGFLVNEGLFVWSFFRLRVVFLFDYKGGVRRGVEVFVKGGTRFVFFIRW